MKYQSSPNPAQFSICDESHRFPGVGKTICALLCLALAGCATQGTTTAPLVAALTRAKASTAAAVADNAKVRELARTMGKGVVELDGQIHRASSINRYLDSKAVRALEILDQFHE